MYELKIAIKVILLICVIYLSVILAFNYFMHCEYATIFEYYNLCHGDREKAKALIEEMKM